VSIDPRRFGRWPALRGGGPLHPRVTFCNGIFTFLVHILLFRDKPVSRSVTPAGSSTASSTASIPTGRSHQRRASEEAMTLSTPSSPRLDPGSMFPGAFSSISSHPSLTRSAREATASCSTQSSSSLERRTPPTILPVDITLLERKLLTLSWTG
jgi:hypothetical protein